MRRSPRPSRALTSVALAVALGAGALAAAVGTAVSAAAPDAGGTAAPVPRVKARGADPGASDREADALLRSSAGKALFGDALAE